MKKILVTGANSYIGTSFEQWMLQYDEYQIETIDMIDGSWRKKDFSGYDVVFHVAGIAHIKETTENVNLYYAVNRDLTIETAKKCKESGVKQFVFLSSMSVYGLISGKITNETVPCPKTNYGKSKYEAEIEILSLVDSNFKVSIIRPPMVYGEGCKGNYVLLSKFANKIPFFIRTNNKRSMIFIDNLCEFIYKVILNELSGIFCPQNFEYVSTDEMVKKIALCNGKKVFIIPFLGELLKYSNFKKFNKIIGDLTYENFQYGFDYNVVKEFYLTISKSECKNIIKNNNSFFIEKKYKIRNESEYEKI